MGQGVIILNSEKVTLTGNVIHEFVKFGVTGDASEDFTIEQNVINGVRVKAEENWPWPYDFWLGEFAGVQLKSSTNYVVKDNIVASVWHAGYMLPPYECGGTAVHTGNVAHSISGYGLIVQPPVGSELDCAEFSDFRGYKTRLGAMHMGGGIKSKTS